MKYQAFLGLDCLNYSKCSFAASASTEQAAINKVRKQAIEKGFNALNSKGLIAIYKRKNSEYDDNYYYVKTILAWK